MVFVNKKNYDKPAPQKEIHEPNNKQINKNKQNTACSLQQAKHNNSDNNNKQQQQQQQQQPQPPSKPTTNQKLKQ